MSDISAGELEYMEQHPNADRAPGILACGIICLTFAVAAVSMRLISRRMVGLSLGLDDYTILLALILYIAFTTFLILTTRFGMGKHIIYISSAKWLTISITVAEALYVLTIMTVKCAILMFYRRVFPQKWFHTCIWVMVALVISYNISSFFATILQCVPVKHQWDTSVPAKCIDYFAVVVYSGVFNVVTDFIILGMPIPLILKLQVSENKKRGLIIVFSWGIAACVVSIARTIKASALTSADSSWDLAGALYATTLEVCMEDQV
ncbi:hypothetical protein N7493_002973 [Penicillium malachiteum]|uniref:Rhodopsin domain-containing protein n=1 Tax=Penicillium malachiteum TaxID=1324776 RepID=A0AAD6MZ99_9EURO|nr:hypothetical protein N7493_002973 [Penicillium malachiteum]